MNSVAVRVQPLAEQAAVKFAAVAQTQTVARALVVGLVLAAGIAGELVAKREHSAEAGPVAEHPAQLAVHRLD